jgi:hypothetical protein
VVLHVVLLEERQVVREGVGELGEVNVVERVVEDVVPHVSQQGHAKDVVGKVVGEEEKGGANDGVHGRGEDGEQGGGHDQAHAVDGDLVVDPVEQKCTVSITGWSGRFESMWNTHRWRQYSMLHHVKMPAAVRMPSRRTSWPFARASLQKRYKATGTHTRGTTNQLVLEKTSSSSRSNSLAS